MRKKRKKPVAVARALVSKEIARIAYHVLSKQEDFKGRFKGVPLSRQKKELTTTGGGGAAPPKPGQYN